MEQRAEGQACVGKNRRRNSRSLCELGSWKVSAVDETGKKNQVPGVVQGVRNSVANALPRVFLRAEKHDMYPERQPREKFCGAVEARAAALMWT